MVFREKKVLKAQLEEMVFRDQWVYQDLEDLLDHLERMETRWEALLVCFFIPVKRNVMTFSKTAVKHNFLALCYAHADKNKYKY